MSDTFKLIAELRTDSGTGSARELRRSGRIPAVIYGKERETIHISLEEKEVTKLYRKPGFTTKIIDIEVDGKTHKTLTKAIQLHPTTELATHLDLVFLVDDKSLQKVEVPIVYKGKERSNGVKKGGFFNMIHRRVTLLCEPDKIPANIEIDVTSMNVGNSYKASRLPLPEGTKLYSKKNFVIASITGRGGKSSSSEEEESSESAA